MNNTCSLVVCYSHYCSTNQDNVAYLHYHSANENKHFFIGQTIRITAVRIIHEARFYYLNGIRVQLCVIRITAVRLKIRMLIRITAVRKGINIFLRLDYLHYHSANKTFSLVLLPQCDEGQVVCYSHYCSTNQDKDATLSHITAVRKGINIFL